MEHEEVYVSVDIEASGPVPGEYSMLSLGACRVDIPERKFYVELQPISQQFVPEALQVSGFSLDALGRTGIEPREAMQSFYHWIIGTAENSIPIFVGFNASFDWGFVNWYFHRFIGKNPFGIGALDIKAYYMGLTDCLWQETRSSKLPSMLIQNGDDEQRHNALSDARRQAAIFRRMMDFRAKLIAE
jgi:DNA polymerase III epsilon subunit-like protein